MGNEGTTKKNSEPDSLKEKRRIRGKEISLGTVNDETVSTSMNGTLYEEKEETFC